MKHFEWNEEKSDLLKQSSNISFEQIIYAILNGGLLDRLKHPNSEKHPNQYIFQVLFEDYVYSVPFVEDDNKIFLKTIYPNREATKLYFGGKK